MSDTYEQTLSYCLSYKVLSKDEEHRLKEVAQEDKTQEEVVRQKLINHNLRLVLSLALKYYNSSGQALPLMDLVQSGCHGLTKAAKAYGFKSRASFSTFAYWYIVGKIILQIKHTLKSNSYKFKGKVYPITEISLSQEDYSYPDSEKIGDRIGDNSAMVAREIDLTERIDWLYEGIDKLNKTHKKTMILYAGGMGVKDIAKRQGITVRAVWSRIRKSIAKLRANPL